MVSGEKNRSEPPFVPVPLSPGRPRRRDAERNRDRVLHAARELIEEQGVDAMTMDALAARAGVGKGTLYRGFGSRAALAEALVDDAERDLQGRILSGPPPLGPGAPAGARLVAFVSAYLELLEGNVALLLETERGAQGARFHTGAYSFWHAYLAALMRAQDREDADLRAHLLLATLSAELFQHLRSSNISRRRLEATISEMALGDTTTRGLSQRRWQEGQ